MTSNAEYVSQIRQCLEEKNITIRDLSHRTGIPYRTLQNYLSECRKMPLGSFSIIAKAIGLPSLGERSPSATGEGQIASDLVILRLMSLLHVTTDTALAKVLGVSKQTISAWRTRESIPFNICIDIAQKTGASLDFIILGRTGKLPLISSAREAKSSSEAAEANRTEHTGLGDIDMAVLFSAVLSKLGVPRLIDVDEKTFSFYFSGDKSWIDITVGMLPAETPSPAHNQEPEQA